MERQNSDIDGYENGAIKISDEVVATVSGLLALEVPGVASMSGGITGGISDVLGRKSPTRGVKLTVGEREVSIDLSVIIEYGYRIPEVAWAVQEKVKKSLENMTGLNVIEVNIHVQGINIQKEHIK